MTESVVRDKPPLGIRAVQAIGKEPDYSTLTASDLAALQIVVNRKRSSRAMRLITGFPNRGAKIEWRHLTLPGRELPVRVYRPANTIGPLPLVLHVHGGGFVGTATQCDWINSHVAVRLPAVVVSVEHRLLDYETPLTAAADDVWEVLRAVSRVAEQWSVDLARTVVVGESAGALMCALTAIRAAESGLRLRGQVLVNPVVDLTAAGFDTPSMRRHERSPMLTLEQIRMFERLAVPPGTDPRALSPLYIDAPRELAPAFVAVPTVDPVADHGRAYAARLNGAGMPAQLIEYPGAPHAFLSLPNVVPQAKAARTDILRFLREVLE